jgi:hypothetical protein
MLPETFIAEFDDCAHEGPLRSTNNPCLDIDMEVDWEQERLNRERAIERVLSERDSNHIKEGIESYKRDLPQMLREQKERHVVAYDGSQRVGIAKTREELLTELKRKGLANNSSVFIKIISSLEDKKESFCSSNHR